MELKGRLGKELRATAKTFADVLDQIDPTKNNYPERMVSYYYIQALASALARSERTA